MIDELLQIGQKEAKFRDKIFKFLEIAQDSLPQKSKKNEDPFSRYN